MLLYFEQSIFRLFFVLIFWVFCSTLFLVDFIIKNQFRFSFPIEFGHLLAFFILRFAPATESLKHRIIISLHFFGNGQLAGHGLTLQSLRFLMPMPQRVIHITDIFQYLNFLWPVFLELRNYSRLRTWYVMGIAHQGGLREDWLLVFHLELGVQV